MREHSSSPGTPHTWIAGSKIATQTQSPSVPLCLREKKLVCNAKAGKNVNAKAM